MWFSRMTDLSNNIVTTGGSNVLRVLRVYGRVLYLNPFKFLDITPLCWISKNFKKLPNLYF